MTVAEAKAVVDRHPGLSLREVDADNPVVTLDYYPGRIDVVVRKGVLVTLYGGS
jgi:hypothetical protein